MDTGSPGNRSPLIGKAGLITTSSGQPQGTGNLIPQLDQQASINLKVLQFLNLKLGDIVQAKVIQNTLLQPTSKPIIPQQHLAERPVPTHPVVTNKESQPPKTAQPTPPKPPTVNANPTTPTTKTAPRDQLPQAPIKTSPVVEQKPIFIARLNVAGKLFSALSQYPLQPGEHITLKANESGTLQVIDVKTPLSTQLNSLVQQHLRAALPQQTPPAKLLSHLLQLINSHRQPIDKELRRVIQQLLRQLPTPRQITQPEGLKTALQNSGTLFESKLTTLPYTRQPNQRGAAQDNAAQQHPVQKNTGREKSSNNNIGNRQPTGNHTSNNQTNNSQTSNNQSRHHQPINNQVINNQTITHHATTNSQAINKQATGNQTSNSQTSSNQTRNDHARKNHLAQPSTTRAPQPMASSTRQHRLADFKGALLRLLQATQINQALQVKPEHAKPDKPPAQASAEPLTYTHLKAKAEAMPPKTTPAPTKPSGQGQHTPHTASTLSKAATPSMTQDTPEEKSLQLPPDMIIKNKKTLTTPLQSHEKLLATIQKQVTETIARSLIHQFTTLSKQQGTTQDSQPQQFFQTEVPILNGSQINTVLIKFEEHDHSGGSDNDREKAKEWVITLAFDLDRMGVMHVQVKLVNDVVNAKFWAEQQNTLEKIQQDSDFLAKNLSDAGIELRKLECCQGPPPEINTGLDYTLVDIET